MSKATLPLTVAGRSIGTYQGWDQVYGAIFQFYDFKPISGFTIPACEYLQMNYEAGELFNDTDHWDLIDTLRNLPRA